MNGKILTILALASAVIALSVSVAVRSVKRAETARAGAARAASEEEIAIREARKAESEQKSAEAAARAETAKRDKAKADAERAVAEQKTASHEAAAAAAERDRAASDAAAARDRAKAAAEQAAAAKAAAAKAASEEAKARAEEAKAKHEADAAADRLAAAKARADASAEEAKALELRKIDFETWQTRLAELEQDLDERERELRPEATIYNSSNVTWVAEREPDEIGATGTVRRVKREPVLPENDPALPRPTRRLAKTERLAGERLAELELSATAAAVSALERLYVRARDDGRVIDAEYYVRAIRHISPQWVYRPGKESSHGE